MWKTVLVGSDAILTVETGWLCVSRPDKLTRIPIGDVYSVVIDEPRCRISAASMNALTQNGAHIILCDEKHLPAALVYAVSPLSDTGRIFHAPVFGIRPNGAKQG